MLFTEKEKAFCVLEFDKNVKMVLIFFSADVTSDKNVLNVNFLRSHQTDVPYKNGTRNLTKRDICAPEKVCLVSKGWRIEHT